MAKFLSSIAGFGVTFGSMFKRPVTESYPEHPGPVMPAVLPNLVRQQREPDQTRAQRHQKQQRADVTGERVAQDHHGRRAGKQTRDRGQRVGQHPHRGRADSVVQHRERHRGDQP